MGPGDTFGVSFILVILFFLYKCSKLFFPWWLFSIDIVCPSYSINSKNLFLKIDLWKALSKFQRITIWKIKHKCKIMKINNNNNKTLYMYIYCSIIF
jgi:hypothetical protein